MATGDECRIDLVTGKTLHNVRSSAEGIIASIAQSNYLLVRIPTDPPTWLNPAHIVTIQDTDPDSASLA